MSLHEAPRLVRDSGLKYLPDLALVEEISKDRLHAFPHTDQLAAISKAVDREFFEALPERLAKTDHRGDHRRKFTLHQMASRFCDFKNELRDDGLILSPVLRRDLVARVAVVQRVTKSTPRGRWNYFRYFADGALFPFLYFFDTPFFFSTHVFDRYRERVGKSSGVPFATFLMSTLSQWGVLMRVNGRERAIVYPHAPDSVIALTMDVDTDPGRVMFTTCLTGNEIRSMEPGDHPIPMFFHFRRAYAKRVKFNLNFSNWPAHLIEIWKRNIPAHVPVIQPGSAPLNLSWHQLAHRAWQDGKMFNFPDGGRFAFAGNFHSVPGVVIRPGPHEPWPLEDFPEEGPDPQEAPENGVQAGTCENKGAP